MTSWRGACPFFPRLQAGVWARVRRYAVPRWMIEEATERRLAGDWRGACAVANVDTAGIDLARVARERGAAVAEAIEDDLRHLAPDLLRWHLPRDRTLWGDDEITLRSPLVLASYEGALLRVRPARHGSDLHGVVLEVYLGGRRPETPNDWTGVRHLWDARRVPELLAWCGGDGRAPFFHADGTPLTASELPACDPGPADPVGRTEWITLLHQRGDIAAAFAVAGIETDPKGDPLERAHRFPLAPFRLKQVMSRWNARHFLVEDAIDAFGYHYLAGQDRAGRLALHFQWDEDGGTLGVTKAPPRLHGPHRRLPRVYWERYVDLDLLWAGRITPDELHPLVRSALFPQRPAPDGPVGPPDPGPPPVVRVRCRGEWHELVMVDGVLRPARHHDGEWLREKAMAALGGRSSGCFAVLDAWGKGTVRLPRRLRAYRREVMARARHRDGPGLQRMRELGCDLDVRDSSGRPVVMP
ncbi:hypothetical protein ABZ801_38415 [Actinomadura sp. NPDC047616]|uniref:hypothetical protein n=1 Tax=Actinomadura sp. NPDC047616 TaxID=3155914 RepID=UPI0033E89E6B